MGLRDRLRGVKKRVQERQEPETSVRRKSVEQLRAMLESAESPAPRREDDAARDQFARAEQTATAAAPMDATLDPMGSPEYIEGVASGTDPRRGDDRGRRDSRDQGTMEDLVLGTDGDRDTGTLEDMVTGGGPDESEDDDDGGILYGGK